MPFPKRYESWFDHVALRWVAVAAVLAATVVLVAIPVPDVGASEEPIYLSCSRPAGQAPVSIRKPRNCAVSAVELQKHSGEFVLLNLRHISWHSWGAKVARAKAVLIGEAKHTRAKVRVMVKGSQICDARAYYATLVLLLPEGSVAERVNVLHLGCG